MKTAIIKGAVIVIALVSAIAAWTVTASAILCKMSGGMDAFVFPYDQWWEVRSTWFGVNWWATACVIGSGFIAAVPTLAGVITVALIVRVWWRSPRRRLVPSRSGGVQPPVPGVTDNHGHARFASQAEIAPRFSGPGCLIGAADRGVKARLWFDDVTTGPGHSLIVAGPGSDKTTSAITRIFRWRGPRVVFDPSLEIGPVMAPALTAAGFNVTSIGLAGQGVNVLDWIDIRHPEADAHIRTAVDWIYDEREAHRSGGNNRDPFFAEWGRALVTCLAAHMLHSSDPQLPKTLATLRRGIAIPEDLMQTMLRGINLSSHSAMARDLAGGLMGMKAEKTFTGIYSNAFAATEWLSVNVYADVASGSAMRTADILDPSTVVFIQLPLRTLLVTPALGRAVLGAFFNAMFHADGDIAETILFQIDEAWILGALKEVKLCHTTARKYRGCVSSIWQSEAQLDDVWGKDGAKILRDTVSWRSYNAIQDGSVAEQLSRDIGEHAVKAWSEGTNSGNQRQPLAWLGSQSRGENVSEHEIKRRVIKADEIMRAPADEMFVLARNFPWTIRCVSAPYFRYPELAGLMSHNRFVRAAVE